MNTHTRHYMDMSAWRQIHTRFIPCHNGFPTALVLSLAGAFVPQDTFGITDGCYSLLSILSPTMGSNGIVALNLAQIISHLACPCLCWRGLRGYCRSMSTAPLYREYARGRGESWLCTATISSLWSFYQSAIECLMLNPQSALGCICDAAESEAGSCKNL